MNRPRFGAIILAAGLSSRMVDTENKVLLPWRDGTPIVRHVASKFVGACPGNVLVVTGRDAAQVRNAVNDLNVTCVHNPDFATGEILSSVKVGLRALPDGLVASFIQPADMPCVPEEVIAQLGGARISVGTSRRGTTAGAGIRCCWIEPIGARCWICRRRQNRVM